MPPGRGAAERAEASRFGAFARVVAWLLLLVAALFVVGSARADDAGASANLLFGKEPIRAGDARRLERLTDGERAREGDSWKSLVTKPFRGRNSDVVYDLGADLPIRAAWLQGDHNDSYELQISGDGKSFSKLWVAEPQRSSGLRTRSTRALDAHGRYLRLQPLDGDGLFGVSELQVFSTVPDPFPPQAEEVRARSLDGAFRDSTTLLGLALLPPLLLVHRGSSRGMIALSLGVVAVALYQCGRAYFECLPVDPREVSLVRGMLGAVAACAVARELFAPRRYPAHRPIVLGTLGLTGVLGVLAFYNLGQPQFYSDERDEWTFAHYLDLRQYYTTAKYFDPIGYRGTYEADIAAYLEDRPEQEQEIQQIRMRDLHSLRMSTPAKQRERIAAMKQRFSPEEWQALKSDVRWFREAMGEAHWLEMLIDFGGNATPVWMTIAHFVFRAVPPSDSGFTLLGLLDPLLLAGMFFAVFRCYGPRTTLVAMTVFGANDFIMYGTNWGGAMLRHDWLAYLGFAACALRRERFALGGALLGLATMIRVFPALALLGAALPAVIRLFEHVQETRKLPSLRELVARERDTARLIAGAAVAMLVAFLVSIAVLSPEAWPECLKKVAEMNADPHPASLSLRSLIAGSSGNQGSVLRARQPLFIAACTLYVGLVVLAARKRRIDQAALLGMVLVPILLYPANYYLHFVFLLPLLATENRPATRRAVPVALSEGGVWLTLLVMCAVQYFTVLTEDMVLHFYLETVVMCATLLVLLAFLVQEDVREWAAREAS
ncbi:MAG TPA: glycosyltransferase 87 family protein [Polyangiaceae bacterium]